jgi:hypothetical protein
MLALWIIAVASACWWLLQLRAAVCTVRSIPVLHPDATAWVPEGDDRVSVICPARNEGDEIEAAMRTRLSDPAPWLEFIAIDDRSTDETPEILDRLAAEDSRLTVLHLSECPDNWLGKVHAQYQGEAIATGRWLLFSDGDTHVEPGMVAAALASMDKAGADMLALLPRIVDGPWLLRAALPTLMRMLMGSLRIWEANDDSKERVMGVGAFNLVSKEALQRAGGIGVLSMEIADDVGLAHIVKQSGGRARLALAAGGVWIRWYRSVSDLLSGTEKGCAKAGSRGRLCFGLSMAGVLLTVELSPFLLWIWLPSTPSVISLVTAAVAVATSLMIAVRFRQPVGWALLPPLATLIAGALAIRAVTLAIIRGGIRWKGDAHTLAAAREGERVQL